MDLFAIGGGRNGEGDNDRHRNGEGIHVRVLDGDDEGSHVVRDGDSCGDCLSNTAIGRPYWHRPRS